MDENLLNIISGLETRGLFADSLDDIDALMRGLPLLGCCDGEVRWSSVAEIQGFEPPEDWHPSLSLQMFGGNMYGDFWCFQPTKTRPTAVTFVTHDLDEAVRFAPSFELFLFRAILNATTFRSQCTWRDWSLSEVEQIMRAGVNVVSTLIAPELTKRLHQVLDRGARLIAKTKYADAYFSWITQAEADGIAADVAGWSELDEKFMYSMGSSV